MLKGIPRILSPELMKILMEMGHGDEIVLADSNFPAASCARKLVRADGHAMLDLLDAILAFFPIDTYTAYPVTLMQVVPGDPMPAIWEKYRQILIHHGIQISKLGFVERMAFYEKARQSYAIVATGEESLYANIVLKKGVIEAAR
ncbi:RbsD/FucU family protein [Alicyclobacillus fodiniaquatilis]|uniref:RbsD/FucU family protein n=1 Tax=Alicyclobacillus fodiniaquatilis TaxID=1661150 RepID=A0ABW4JNA8_9BACL